jgi:4-aminobutyrate aminotransferase-like enzyme
VINVPAPRTLRFLPPLVIGETEIDEALEILSRCVR